MKTLVVLSALAAIALAAPALPDGDASNVKLTVDRTLSKRERKSTEPISIQNVDTTSPSSLHLDAAQETSARTIGLKKPIIIKKNHGYHLYRDPEEEQAQADPQEQCMKEVKVKLCDSKSNGNIPRSTIEDNEEQTSESDIEQSIKLAKEAVENLQRDLQTMEQNSEPKMSQWKHTESDSDSEMHEDIEVARQALEHIQQNFATLESMNLRTTSLKDAESFQDEFRGKTEEERMAQWKEAIKNIQRNVEIVRNIEDSFKSASSETSLSASADSAKKLESIEHPDGVLMKSTENNPNTMIAKNMNAKEQQGMMMASASERKESIVLPNEQMNSKTRSNDVRTHFNKEVSANSEEIAINVQSNTLEKKSNNEQTKQGKSSELGSSLNIPVSAEHMKLADINEDEHNTDKMKTAETTENIHDSDLARSAHIMKSSNEFSQHAEQRTVKEWKTNDFEKSSAKDAWEHTEVKNMLSKSAENVNIVNEKKDTEMKMHHAKLFDLDTTSLMKSAEHLEEHKDKQKWAMDANFKTTQEAAENIESSKSASKNLAFEETSGKEHITMMKSAEQLEHQQVNAVSSAHLQKSDMAQSHLHHEMTQSMKAADDSDFPQKKWAIATATNQDEGKEASVDLVMKSPEIAAFRNNKEHEKALMMKSFDQVAHQSQKSIHSVPSNLAEKAADITPFRNNAEHEHSFMMKSSDQAAHQSEQSMHVVPSNFKTINPQVHHNEMSISMKAAGSIDNQQETLGMLKLNEQKIHPGSAVVSSRKEAEIFENGVNNIEHGRNVVSLPVAPNQFESLPTHSFLRNGNKMVINGKSADMDSNMQPSHQIDMKDAVEKSALENGNMEQQWKHKQGVSRGAYGSAPYGLGASALGLGAGALSTGAAGGAGAVGVFPNAKVGGCAIPLLLSCSPSVVSGSLAKSHPSYGSPAYRGGEDFKIHNKRNIVKNNELPNKVQRTPKRTQNIPLDKKL